MNILLTFDYELFSGNNPGSVKKCIYEPTNKIIKILDKYGVKATFFVDSSFIYQLSKEKSKSPLLESDWNQIVSQLQELDMRGHDIQLHIHPQWYYSFYRDGKWIIDQNRFKISDMDDDIGLIKDTKLLLESIIGHNVIGFRAGGFSLQSYTNYIRLFNELGISADSSVVPGKVFKSTKQWFDFTNIHTHNVYHFSDDINRKDEKGHFIEIPISTMRLSPLNSIIYSFKSIVSKKYIHRYGDGIAIVDKQTNRFKIIKQVLNILSGSKIYASFDATYSNGIDYFTTEKYSKENDTLCIISHPKLLSDYAIDKMERFVSVYSKNNYFCSMKMLSNILNL